MFVAARCDARELRQEFMLKCESEAARLRQGLCHGSPQTFRS